MAQKIWHLKNCDLFTRLSEQEIEDLESQSLSKKVNRGGSVYIPQDQAEGVFLLVKGRIKICHVTPEGKQSILSFVEPGELFGELSFLQQSDRGEYAEAIESSLVVFIPRNVFNRVVQRHPSISMHILRLIGLRRTRVERRLKHLLFLSNKDRLIHLLLELVEQYGQRAEHEIALGINLSHQDLANLIGSTRESVTLLLGELQTEGLIRTARRRIWVLDLDRLAKSVDVTAPVLKNQHSVPSNQSIAQPRLI